MEHVVGDAVSQPEPVARGTLGETPLCHVALYLYRRNSSGTLVIDAGQRTETRIRFARGRPIAARIPFARDGLLACLLPLCGLRAGSFEFYELDMVGEGKDVVQGVVDPYELVTASLDDHARDDMVDELLERYASVKLRFQPGRDLARLRIASRDGALLELIRAAPATPRELIEQAPLPHVRTRRLLYALIATHMVSPHQDKADETFRSQVDVDAESGTVPISEVTAKASPAWQQLASLRPGAPGTSIAPGLRGASMRPPSGPIASLRPAPTSGAPPPRSQRPLAGSASKPPSADDYQSGLRRIEQLVQRGRADEALQAVDELLEVMRDASELLGLRALALFEKHRADDDGVARVVVDAVKRALERDPDNTRALFTRGLMLKRAGDTKKALAYFKRVAQLDPKHLEAQREVRLARLRGE